jgi:hypothetical protein
MPIDSATLIELAKQTRPRFVQRPVASPFDEASPAGGVRREAGRQVFPAGTAAKHPQDAFKTSPWISHWAAAFRTWWGIREEISNQLPLLVDEFWLQVVRIGLHPGPRAVTGSIRHQKSPFDS